MSEGKKEILLGDCLELMKDIDDGSVDMILADLPYGTTACKWDTIIPFDKLWEQYERIIKDNGVIVLTASQPFTSALVMSNPKLFKHEWIWEKHKGTNLYQVKSAPMKVHESALVFSKGTYTYNPQMTEGAPYKKRGSHHKLPKDHVMTPGKNIGYSDNLDTSKRYPTSVQFFSNHNQKANRFHPTQKPVALFEYLIKTYTNENDLVLDNCAGSCTTAIAALNTNRNYICMEKEERYYNIGLKRVKEWHENKKNKLF
jgi:site-specific DNA-methyltransferase (adenine-specific)